MIRNDAASQQSLLILEELCPRADFATPSYDQSYSIISGLIHTTNPQPRYLYRLFIWKAGLTKVVVVKAP